ncbi:hypothetical protein HGRIS_008805 [Hohenbuehelia grisea]|uniref:Yeast cell wall synthesis Kre9/Knh1-like N-terminal domain-containing protein n=1 Tax=Hohenbuehelia grisea TaxID=104357 RepID=A0ABR3JAM7_9AGAR
MFLKFSFLLLHSVAFVASLSIDAPKDPHSASPVTINWQNSGNDFASISTFSIFLINQQFNNFFGIANNVPQEDSRGGSITLLLPAVTVPDGYTIQFTDIGNRTNVFGESPPFSINLDPASTTASSVSSASALSTGALSSASGSSPVTPRPVSTSAFGTTVSAAPVSSVTQPGSATASGATSGTSPAASGGATGAPFNAAQKITGGSTVFAVVVAALAGVMALAV